VAHLPVAMVRPVAHLPVAMVRPVVHLPVAMVRPVAHLPVVMVRPVAVATEPRPNMLRPARRRMAEALRRPVIKVLHRGVAPDSMRSKPSALVGTR